MADVLELQTENRENLGKAASRRLRRLENKFPAVLYGAGKDPAHFVLDHNKIIKALENEAFYSSILTLDVAGQKEKAVLKAIQRHPAKPKILHMDFQRVSAKEKLTMQVPLHFLGEDVAPGVKLKGGIISHHETSVEISCLPADLPEFIDVDIANLDLDESIHLSQLKLPKGAELVDLMHENDKPVVSIHLPRVAEVEEAAPEEEAEAGAEEGEKAEAKEEKKESE